MAELYKSTLADVCKQFFTADSQNAVEWATLSPLVDEAVLQEAHHAGDKQYRPLFVAANNDLDPILRPVKNLARVQFKAGMNKPDAHFKANSDLCAFRFKVWDVSEIHNVMDIIRQSVISAGGSFFIRNPIMDNGELKDIVLVAFAYVPSFGYIAEIQVGHPFGLYTFMRDTQIRNLKLAGEAGGPDDLWDNDFYGKVKARILSFNSDPADFKPSCPEKAVPIEQEDEELYNIVARYFTVPPRF